MPRRNLFLILAVILLGVLSYQRLNALPRSQQRMLETYGQVLREVRNSYVEEVDERKLFESSLKGLLDPLDSNSAYIAPTEYNRLRESLDLRFVGIGIHVMRDVEADVLVVVSPLVGTPAFGAGLRAGDQILAIDGQTTQGLEVEQAVGLIRGPSGLPVTLRIRSAGDGAERDVVIVREEIHTPSVLGDHYQPDGSWSFMLEAEPGIGLVRLQGFGKDTAEELTHALEQLQQEGLQGLILDVRGNPGGLLQSAVDVCNLFVERGTIVTMKSRIEANRTYAATESGTYKDFPIVVLINGASASASEIVAACLQDHHRATVLGTRSYGKGSVQNVVELERGASALKLTIATYWRPSNKNIHRMENSSEDDEWGVTPDLKVPLEGEALEKAFLARRERDIYRPSRPQPPRSALDADPQMLEAVKILKHKIEAKQTPKAA